MALFHFVNSVRFGLGLCLIATTSIRAQTLPTAYHLGTAVALPDSLDEVFAAGRFTAVVRRAVADPEDRRLIDLAERIYPNQEIILQSAKNPKDLFELSRPHRGRAS